MYTNIDQGKFFVQLGQTILFDKVIKLLTIECTLTVENSILLY